MLVEIIGKQLKLEEKFRKKYLAFGIIKKKILLRMNIDKIKITNYDTNQFPFKEIVEDILGHSPLNEFHKTIKTEIALADEKNDQDTDHHRLFYSKFEEKLIPVFHDFVRSFIKPLFKEDIVFQARPTFRCNIPNNRAVPYHRDSDFNHGCFERNFWLPFTDTNKENSIIIESGKGKKDFKPYLLKYGELLFFDGANLEHGNEINSSNKTRMSMDFRISLESMFENSSKTTLSANTKMVLGDYWIK